MPRLAARLFLGAAILVVVALSAVFAFIYSGVYDVAATRQHTAPVYWAFLTALRQSVRRHAAREAPPPPDLADADLIATGLVLYDRHCQPCHGAPGVAPDPLGLGATPPPPNLVLQGRDWPARELYWTVSNGLKLTGMPAWEFRMTEQERWAVVAFIKVLPTLAPAEYEVRRAALAPPPEAREVRP